MKIRVLALSTVLLLSTGAFAQDNAPATTNGSSMSAMQNGTQTGNGNAMPSSPSDNMHNTHPYGNRHRHHGGWGWIGIFGLLGLFGLGGGRRTRDAVVTTGTLPPR